MKILQNVIVNQVLTESSKNQLLEKYKSKRLQLQKESEQLRFELKKAYHIMVCFSPLFLTHS